MMIACPSGNTKRSTCGLTLTSVIAGSASSRPISISESKCPMLHTMVSSFMTAMCSLVTTLLQPVAVTTMSARSEEHTSELQSQSNLVCRLLLEKKNHLHPPPSSYLHAPAATDIYTLSLHDALPI